MNSGSRRGRPRRGSVRASSMQLEQRDLPYWRRQHTVRELLYLQRAGRLDDNRLGDRTSVAPGVASYGVEGEWTQLRQSSSTAVTTSLYLSSSSPPGLSPSSRLPMSPNVNVELLPSVVDDASQLTVSLRLSSSSGSQLSESENNLTSCRHSSDAEWNEFIDMLIASSNESV